MALDRWIAVFFLTISIVYGYAAFNYELLPFERNMAFLPNTMPMALSVVGALLSLVLLLALRAAYLAWWHVTRLGRGLGTPATAAG